MVVGVHGYGIQYGSVFIDSAACQSGRYRLVVGLRTPCDVIIRNP